MSSSSLLKSSVSLLMSLVSLSLLESSLSLEVSCLSFSHEVFSLSLSLFTSWDLSLSPEVFSLPPRCYHNRFSDPFFFLVSLPLSRPRLSHAARSLEPKTPVHTPPDHCPGKPVNLAEWAVSLCSILESVVSRPIPQARTRSSSIVPRESFA